MDRQYNRVKTGKIVAAVFFLCAAVYLLSLFFVNQRVVTVDVSGCVTDALIYLSKGLDHLPSDTNSCVFLI